MLTCASCKKVEVPNDGCKIYINYNYLVVIREDNDIPLNSETIHQIRLCPKCLKKKKIEVNI